MVTIINISALYKELVHRYGNQYTYLKVKWAIEGNTSAITDKEKKQIATIVDEQMKKAKENILNHKL